MMTDLLMILVLFVIVGFFWQLRQMAEHSKHFVENECIKQNVQLLAIAQESAKPCFGGHSGISWKTKYFFEFSTDGLNQYRGYLWMIDKKIQKIEWPIFPEPEWQQAPLARKGNCGTNGGCNSGGCR